MLKPTGYGILIKLDVVEEKSAGGIVLASESVEKERRGRSTGTVVELGSLAYSDFEGGAWVKPGDKIFFRRYSGPYMPFNDEYYMIVEDRCILGTMDKDDEIDFIVG